jgi:probable HAF family extracellular repeat protein
MLKGINDKGQAVGFYEDSAGNTHGMLVNGVS